jgi:hypothetical protein
MVAYIRAGKEAKWRRKKRILRNHQISDRATGEPHYLLELQR